MIPSFLAKYPLVVFHGLEGFSSIEVSEPFLTTCKGSMSYYLYFIRLSKYQHVPEKKTR